MTGIFLLAVGFIKGDRTSHGYIQGFDNPHLRNDKVSVGQLPDFSGDALVFVAKYQRQFFVKSISCIATDCHQDRCSK